LTWLGAAYGMLGRRWQCRFSVTHGGETASITPFMKIAHVVESYGKGVASHTCTEVGAHLVAALANGLTVEYVP
jgi:L-alanine-DL-glutamate epimerase-like enolase superfamily enzyme